MPLLSTRQWRNAVEHELIASLSRKSELLSPEMEAADDIDLEYTERVPRLPEEAFGSRP